MKTYKRWVCYMLGHKYYTFKRFSRTSRRVKCRRCPADWAMCDTAKSILDWDSDFEELYEGKWKAGEK